MNPTDQNILSPRIHPLAAADIRPEWLHQVRAVVIRDGHHLRAGFPACIEVKGTHGWQAINLPNNGIEFMGRRDRDAVLEMLDGRRKLPEMAVKEGAKKVDKRSS